MLRGFRDSAGVQWQVWEVYPTDAGVIEPRRFSRRSLTNTAFANGWLCFESATEKRRLAPIPRGWHERERDTLEELCGRAVPVPVRRQRGGAAQR